MKRKEMKKKEREGESRFHILLHKSVGRLTSRNSAQDFEYWVVSMMSVYQPANQGIEEDDKHGS